MSLRIIFAGTPQFAAEHLKTLIHSDHDVIAVYSQPDRPSGRGRKLTASPVKALALENDIPVFQPKNFRAVEDVQQLKVLNADVMVVVAYGLLLPQSILDAPRLGCINVHASLLPRWRGAAPIHRSLLAGDLKTGVTIMQMDKGLDTGAMLVKVDCDIFKEDTSQILHDRLISMGSPALLKALAQLESGTAQPIPQDNEAATYAHKLEKSEGEINWQMSAHQIDRQIRGLSPWPGAYTYWQGQPVRVHQANPMSQPTEQPPGSIIAMGDSGFDVATGEGVLRLSLVQLPGKKAMAVKDVLNSRRQQFEAHSVFGR